MSAAAAATGTGRLAAAAAEAAGGAGGELEALGGRLLKRGKWNNAWKERWCYLEPASFSLVYCEEQGGEPRGSIVLDENASLAQLGSKDKDMNSLTFAVATPGRTWRLRALNSLQAGTWRRAIGAYIRHAQRTKEARERQRHEEERQRRYERQRHKAERRREREARREAARKEKAAAKETAAAAAGAAAPAEARRESTDAESEDTDAARAPTTQATMAGYLEKRGKWNATWRRRWCYLEAGSCALYYCANPQAPPKGFIRIDERTPMHFRLPEDDLDRASNVFGITVSSRDGQTSRIYKFRAPDMKTAYLWREAIIKYIRAAKVAAEEARASKAAAAAAGGKGGAAAGKGGKRRKRRGRRRSLILKGAASEEPPPAAEGSAAAAAAAAAGAPVVLPPQTAKAAEERAEAEAEAAAGEEEEEEEEAAAAGEPAEDAAEAPAAAPEPAAAAEPPRVSVGAARVRDSRAESRDHYAMLEAELFGGGGLVEEVVLGDLAEEEDGEDEEEAEANKAPAGEAGGASSRVSIGAARVRDSRAGSRAHYAAMEEELFGDDGGAKAGGGGGGGAPIVEDMDASEWTAATRTSRARSSRAALAPDADRPSPAAGGRPSFTPLVVGEMTALEVDYAVGMANASAGAAEAAAAASRGRSVTFAAKQRQDEAGRDSSRSVAGGPRRPPPRGSMAMKPMQALNLTRARCLSGTGRGGSFYGRRSTVVTQDRLDELNRQWHTPAAAAKPVEEPAAKPVAEEPAAEPEPAAGQAAEPAAAEPAAEEPAAEPAVEEPAAEPEPEPEPAAEPEPEPAAEPQPAAEPEPQPSPAPAPGHSRGKSRAFLEAEAESDRRLRREEEYKTDEVRLAAAQEREDRGREAALRASEAAAELRAGSDGGPGAPRAVGSLDRSKFGVFGAFAGAKRAPTAPRTRRKSVADPVNAADGVEVRLGRVRERGLGLFATRDLAAGEAVVVERPAFSVQSSGSDAPVCAHCLKFVGSPESLFHLLGDLEAAPPAPLPHKPDSLGGARKPTMCPGRCGAMYCSKQCQLDAWYLHHELLCPSDATHGAALRKFAAHARDVENERFALAAQVLAYVIKRMERRKLAADEACRWLDAYCQEPWWESIQPPEDLNVGQAGVFANVLVNMTKTSLFLLKKALCRAHTHARLFTLDRYARLLGVFERNNWAVTAPNPLALYVDHVSADGREAELRDAVAAAEAAAGPGGWDRLADAADVAVEGTGLFALGHFCNHSCMPNVQLSKLEGGLDDTTVLVATRDVRAGEELLLSYADPRMRFVDRREALSFYGFECKCPRCLKDLLNHTFARPRVVMYHSSVSGSREAKAGTDLVQRLFLAHRIVYHAVDVSLPENEHVKRAMARESGLTSLPQVFVNNSYRGDARDFAAANEMDGGLERFLLAGPLKRLAFYNPKFFAVYRPDDAPPSAASTTDGGSSSGGAGAGGGGDDDDSSSDDADDAAFNAAGGDDESDSDADDAERRRRDVGWD